MMAGKTDNRSIFDWVVWTVIHLVLVGGIACAGFSVYGSQLGAWVGASALIAAMTSMYLFHVDIKGETLMKVLLGLSVAANAGYLVHNGAQAMGVEVYNAAQVRKFEAGIAAAAKARYRTVAQQVGMASKEASVIEKIFDNEVALIAGMLAFLELALGITFFSIASKRHRVGDGIGEAAKSSPRATVPQISMSPRLNPTAKTGDDPKA